MILLILFIHHTIIVVAISFRSTLSYFSNLLVLIMNLDTFLYIYQSVEVKLLEIVSFPTPMVEFGFTELANVCAIFCAFLIISEVRNDHSDTV